MCIYVHPVNLYHKTFHYRSSTVSTAHNMGIIEKYMMRRADGLSQSSKFNISKREGNSCNLNVYFLINIQKLTNKSRSLELLRMLYLHFSLLAVSGGTLNIFM
jgi:hypothetical protein